MWIGEATANAIHLRQIVEHGGSESIRDRNLLLSALDRPQNLFHYSQEKPNFAALAATYAFGIAKNHPFIDGNKRTALVVSRTYLKVNAHDIEATQEEKYRTFLALADGSLSEEELISWFSSKMREVS